MVLNIAGTTYVAIALACVIALAAVAIVSMALIAVFSSDEARGKRAMQIFRALLSFFRRSK
ncbi:hypothetical protein [Streptosporangium sp. V21-05]|uniref:hypothetical protein n=1 Tax=Streptosporangium sp. V21-05 TaxID=3446115 RepID=UPI003F534F09